mmetsp:Transcript_106776/g.300154  ORF Transcript_106776/g.300154 Transcript_106776/m.300154 type:complete len:209 (+) Transcript_106776:163-789(+)
MPLARARSSSRTSSSTRRTPYTPSVVSRWRAPASTSSSMKPALPSKPWAFPTMGPSNSSASSASSSATRIVCSLLFDMMPSVTSAPRMRRSHGSNMRARCRSSAHFDERCAMSPGVAVRVPSKSKKTTRTPRPKTIKSLRDGSGVVGVNATYLWEAHEDGVANFKERVRPGPRAGGGESGMHGSVTRTLRSQISGSVKPTPSPQFSDL